MYGWRDLNPQYYKVLDSKSSAFTNFATSAFFKINKIISNIYKILFIYILFYNLYKSLI